jgi:outer membrane protein OmpA-like peptidoglycan-associated protein
LNRLQGRVKAGMLPGILFKRGETKPGPEAQATMNELGKILEADSEATVTVVGYDSDQAAAVEKAKSVVKYVTMNFRITPDRMHVKAGDPAKQPKNSMIGFEAGAAK